MRSFLKQHPFAVAAHFDSSLVLTYTLPKAQLANLLPPCLQPDTYDDKWAFIAVAMVQTRHLRPKGFPKFLGQSFFLIGYRIFVRYVNEKGKRLRGLYILRSETNRKQMQVLGNLFTHYKYVPIDIVLRRQDEATIISSAQAGLNVSIGQKGADIFLPPQSPFPDWKTARRYAGPLPFTFTWLPEKQQVLIIEGVRQNWKPQPVEVLQHQVGFLNQAPFQGAKLASAFEVEQIPYFWRKGKLESWKANEAHSRGY
ncbi:MAG: DUF2071 domain-containing protein [Bacteroidota bacterium]